LAAIGAYVLAVGPQPSVIRAAVAGSAVSIAWLLARERDPWHVLLLAAVVLLAWNPYTLYDAGFQLSFAAVAAIFVAARPLLGVVANALVEPAVAPLLGLAFGAAAVHPLSPSLAAGLAYVNGWVAAYVAFCARAIGAAPFAQAHGRWAAVAAAFSLVAAAY